MQKRTGKEWAVGLSQDFFNREFQKRFPTYDCIPSIKMYTNCIESEAELQEKDRKEQERYLANQALINSSRLSEIDILRNKLAEMEAKQSKIETQEAEKVAEVTVKPEKKEPTENQKDHRGTHNLQVYKCKYCSREIRGKVGLGMHERKCAKDHNIAA